MTACPLFGELDAYLLREGRHHKLWEVLGAHPRHHLGVDGVAFAVWAPNAQRVSVVGDFCGWDGRCHPMEPMGSTGVFAVFVPKVTIGMLYKFEIVSREGRICLKTDPMAQAMELPPATASRVTQSQHQWSDAAYMTARASVNWRRRPLAIYEVHLGSWARVPEAFGRVLTYQEIAPKLVAHVLAMGFNAVELMPICEHPFSGSWGYQVSGYFAPTARYGSPDDLRALIDICHQSGLAVFADWVPAHFPKDTFALAQFDGTALYEHEDPRRGEHPDWGTLIFNYGRNEVRNFLIASALYWLECFHFDGLRVDAVASMLYLDYSRKPGEWLPNAHGGRENLEAVYFICSLNQTIQELHPDVVMIAEESTAWPGVTQPIDQGGLGFTFKWNMGWMHDTLRYLQADPIHRKYHHDELSFAMVYEYHEHFLMPLSHDEVVHGKGSLYAKMPGDPWQKFANLRLLYTYQFTRPGKKLWFMGGEFAAEREWNHDVSLDWHLCHEPLRQQLLTFVAALGQIYQRLPCLWESDPDPQGFYWIDHQDRDQSVFIYVRQSAADHVVVVLNATPVPRPGYRIGVPEAGTYTVLFNSDDPQYGGSGATSAKRCSTEPQRWHNQPQSLCLALPPLGAMMLAPEPQT